MPLQSPLFLLDISHVYRTDIFISVLFYLHLHLAVIPGILFYIFSLGKQFLYWKYSLVGSQLRSAWHGYTLLYCHAFSTFLAVRPLYVPTGSSKKGDRSYLFTGLWARSPCRLYPLYPALRPALISAAHISWRHPSFAAPYIRSSATLMLKVSSNQIGRAHV